MEFLDYLHVLRRRWVLVLAAPLVALLIAVAVTAPTLHSAAQAAGDFQATHVLYRADTSPTAMPVQTVALVAAGGLIPQRVAAELGGDAEADALASRAGVTADNDMRIVSISAVHSDPEVAERVVNTYAEQILAYFKEGGAMGGAAAEVADTERRIKAQKTEIERLDAQLAELDAPSALAERLRAERDTALRRAGRLSERLELLGGGSAISMSGLRTLQPGVATPVDPATFAPPTTPGPRLLLATLMGLLLGVAMAFVVDRLDTRIRTRRDAEEAFSLPVLTEIPRLKRRGRRLRSVVTTADPASTAAESYRVLRLGLQVMSRWVLQPSHTPGSVGEVMAHRLDRIEDDTPARVFLVTSPGPAEGKTTTVANLAASFAEVDQRVLLLDCDFRSPQLGRTLGVEPGPGVADYLRRGAGRPPLANLTKSTSIPNVWLVPSGEAVGNPAELLGPTTDLLRDAAELADIVLVDVGPLLAVNDGATLAPQVDAVVVVARHGQTTMDAARRSSELLARVEAPVAGVALVGVTTAELGSRYYYAGTLPATNGSTNGTMQDYPHQPQVMR